MNYLSKHVYLFHFLYHLIYFKCPTSVIFIALVTSYPKYLNPFSKSSLAFLFSVSSSSNDEISNQARQILNNIINDSNFNSQYVNSFYNSNGGGYVVYKRYDKNTNSFKLMPVPSDSVTFDGDKAIIYIKKMVLL